MHSQRIAELCSLYRDGLLGDTIPWWQSRFIDEEHGGYLTYRDADGSLLSTDKPVWVLGRVVWLWSRLYNTVEKRQDWLNVAQHGADFMLKHAFDSDGRMFYLLTRDGQPIRKRRYLFTEVFGTIALAELARATGSDEMLERARQLYRLIVECDSTPGRLPPKVMPETRALRGHAMPMVLLVTSQVMREIDPGDSLYDDIAARAIDDIFQYFVKPNKRCLLETVLADGSILDTPEGRTVNPGHAIESCWFMLAEAQHRGDQALIARACEVMEWSLGMGWDREYGGLLYFVDCDGKQPEPYEHDMKLWWPHTEALYGCLLAHHLTGDAKWEEWYERLHSYSFSHFPDHENGEWYGYLHRDGTVSSTVKGNHWKGPFHLPRMQLYGWQLLQEMEGTETAPVSDTRKAPVTGSREKNRILVVDDEESVRRLLIRILEESDIECLVEEASDGAIGCVKLGIFRPQLLIVDLRMPGLDGEYLCKYLKREPEFADVKIIVVTGHPEDEAVARIMDAGANAWMAKPVDIGLFLRNVKECLGLPVDEETKGE